MILKRKVFSKYQSNEFLDQKEFGAASKTLAILSPGGWNAKEAAKYAYEDSEDNYNDNKYKYALLGSFAPGTATYQLNKAKNMKQEGSTPEQIRKAIESSKVTAGGIGEEALNVITGGATSSLSTLAAIGSGLVHKLNENKDRAKPIKSKKKKK